MVILCFFLPFVVTMVVMSSLLDLGQAVGADGELLARGGGNGAYSGISLGDSPSLSRIYIPYNSHPL